MRKLKTKEVKLYFEKRGKDEVFVIQKYVT